MPQNDKYTYENAGFNGLMSRSLKSNAFATGVQSASASSGTTLNLDRQQIASSLGNSLTLGRIVLDGVNGRVKIIDENGVETAWFGNLVP